MIILKPDAVQRAVVGEIVTRFERAGLKMIGIKMLSPSEEHYHHHYETISQLKSRRGKEAFKQNAEFMMSGPVIAVVLEGVQAISLVRKMVGDTDPGKALPGTIRGDYAHMTIDHSNAKKIGLPNLVHASGNAEEAKEEISHWFSAAELFDYSASHEHFTQKKK